MQKACESGSEKEEFRMKGTEDDDIECWGAKILEQLLFGDRKREGNLENVGRRKNDYVDSNICYLSST